MGQVWAIVVAAGSGDRFGGAKQYERLGDRRVIDWSIAAARTVADGVVVVVPEGNAPEPEADVTVPGGSTRSASVRAGLGSVPPAADVVVVHDAARPLAGADLFAAVVARVRDGADAVVPAVPVTDTVRHADGGVVDRALLRAVQTPQAFAVDRLRAAHAGRPDATDDASLVEADGGEVVVVEGHRRNVKITDPDDLVVARALLEAR